MHANNGNAHRQHMACEADFLFGSEQQQRAAAASSSSEQQVCSGLNHVTHLAGRRERENTCRRPTTCGQVLRLQASGIKLQWHRDTQKLATQGLWAGLPHVCRYVPANIQGFDFRRLLRDPSSCSMRAIGADALGRRCCVTMPVSQSAPPISVSYTSPWGITLRRSRTAPDKPPQIDYMHRSHSGPA